MVREERISRKLVFADSSVKNEDSDSSSEEIRSSSAPRKAAKKTRTRSASKPHVPSDPKSESKESMKSASSGIGSTRGRRPGEEEKVTDIRNSKKKKDRVLMDENSEEERVTDIKNSKKKKKKENKKDRVLTDEDSLLMEKEREADEEKERKLLIDELEGYVMYQEAKTARARYLLRTIISGDDTY